ALFCPSGTMTNQIALKILTSPYEEVICYEGSHIYKYEGGGLGGNSGLSPRLIKGDRGRLSAKEIEENINGRDPHLPITSVIALENTVNKGGGSCYALEEVQAIHGIAQKHGLKMHLDGARLFNALEVTKNTPADFGKLFDTLSICLSKGLGAPVGSLLLCDKQYAQKARRMRKVFGGGMRQAGFLAAAGIYALDHHVDRLHEDHARAKVLGNTLQELSFVKEVLPVDTNIVIFRLAEGRTAEQMVSTLASRGIKSVIFGPGEVRFVTHLDFGDDQLEEAVKVLRGLK
ncbi:MAG: beta-eliminating lyase-related protein, partial [Cyclobacteriaceae bacterium]|nr:beta-eliminating lyase-related protein [Cyclobacteriaceae bacterium]